MRQIDADAVIEKCGDWYVEEGPEVGFIGTLKSLIDEQPTVDSVTVVRCADCKFWTACESEENDCDIYGVCNQIGRLTIFDWFCADGERGDESDEAD